MKFQSIQKTLYLLSTCELTLFTSRWHTCTSHALYLLPVALYSGYKMPTVALMSLNYLAWLAAMGQIKKRVTGHSETAPTLLLRFQFKGLFLSEI